MTPRDPGQADDRVIEFLRFIWPRIRTPRTPCPRWPPDVFAVVAATMRRNGAYVRSVIESVCGGKEPKRLLGEDWETHARQIGYQWRAGIHDCLRKRRSDASISETIQRAAVPKEVQNAWAQLLRRAAVVNIERSRDDDELSCALLKLCAYADEACAGIGLPGTPTADKFVVAASFFLVRNGSTSYCDVIDRNRARVLPKKHTPQCGLTLRSLTHHLSLCMPWEANALWKEYGTQGSYDVLNLLLWPWPTVVHATNFQCVELADDRKDNVHYRKFAYRREEREGKDLEEAVERLIAGALRQVSCLHALVLPELALSCAEWQIVARVARRQGLQLVISGILDDVDSADRPINSCRILASDPPSASGEEGTGEEGTSAETDDIPYTQAKHHRWCLDRNQILQYDLGGQLPSTLRCWEDTHIGSRGVSFVTLGGWMTFSVLICEDLARQDPIAEVMRSVGPNLVIALLMDGPQLASRWSARYASVLADDPGTSVLTLTSLGMAERSRPLKGPFEPSRVVGLWKDKIHGTEEIRLERDSEACVLSLACAWREEFTSDGRSDGGMTQVPVFSGIYQISAAAKPG